ncbi:hypothetical protein NL676_026182 [Syzygium grande]|nr:hypothetical protein NL676_026182 [Syzygium grande]
MPRVILRMEGGRPTGSHANMARVASGVGLKVNLPSWKIKGFGYFSPWEELPIPLLCLVHLADFLLKHEQEAGDGQKAKVCGSIRHKLHENPLIFPQQAAESALASPRSSPSSPRTALRTPLRLLPPPRRPRNDSFRNSSTMTLGNLVTATLGPKPITPSNASRPRSSKKNGQNGAPEPKAFTSDPNEAYEHHHVEHRFLIEQARERVRKKQHESSQEASCFEGPEHEVREEGRGPKERALEVQDERF